MVMAGGSRLGLMIVTLFASLVCCPHDDGREVGVPSPSIAAEEQAGI